MSEPARIAEVPAPPPTDVPPERRAFRSHQEAMEFRHPESGALPKYAHYDVRLMQWFPRWKAVKSRVKVEWVSVQDAAIICGMSDRWVRNYINEHNPPWAKRLWPHGPQRRGHFRVHVEGFKQWLETRNHGP